MSTITSIIRSYVKNGITDIIRYNISPIASAVRSKMDGCTKAHSIQMACGPAPDGHLGWTLRLLEEKACIELDVLVGRETIHRTLKNELRHLKNAYLCIFPQENAEFVACIEDIQNIHEMSHNPVAPMVCIDKEPYQLCGEAREPSPMHLGDTQKIDSEYV